MMDKRISDDNTCQILRDWELLQSMNGIQSDRNFRRSIGGGVELDRVLAHEKIDQALRAVDAQLGSLDLPFKVPELSILALLWPGEFSKPESPVAEPESFDDKNN